MPFILTNWKAILLASIAVTCFVAGYTVRGWLADSREKAAIEQAIAEQQAKIIKANARAEEFENRLSELKANARNVNRKVDREIKDSAYSCVLPASGVQLIREAIAPTASPGKPDGKM
jgi:hypothetical protein